VLHIEKNEWVYGYGDIYYGESFETLKCCGCDKVKIRHINWDSAYVSEEGDSYVITTYFPAAVSRREPQWIQHPPYFNVRESFMTILGLFREVYIALRNDCRRLAAMGVRSVIEHIMIEQVGDNGSFRSNLKSLEAAGFISTKQAETLYAIIEAGNATTHRGFMPSEQDLSTLLNIAESLYETVYIHPLQADYLKKRIPPRTR
jgi:hypothetical protein